MLQRIDFVCNLFRLRRHLLTAARYRISLQERFQTWRQITLHCA
jgi:hypothetical protein